MHRVTRLAQDGIRERERGKGSRPLPLFPFTLFPVLLYSNRSASTGSSRAARNAG